ncbi:spidroin-2-like [Eptesicus fuscus]|uniref:spidroin-2-like n=1 Tax=Eptesicus fuscus TaxID=29078 RepID=UPI00240405D7|nr:spidroin-2-like [Eptesicus fuscus]
MGGGLSAYATSAGLGSASRAVRLNRRWCAGAGSGAAVVAAAGPGRGGDGGRGSGRPPPRIAAAAAAPGSPGGGAGRDCSGAQPGLRGPEAAGTGARRRGECGARCGSGGAGGRCGLGVRSGCARGRPPRGGGARPAWGPRGPDVAAEPGSGGGGARRRPPGPEPARGVGTSCVGTRCGAEWEAPRWDPGGG